MIERRRVTLIELINPHLRMARLLGQQDNHYQNANDELFSLRTMCYMQQQPNTANLSENIITKEKHSGVSIILMIA